MSLLSELQPGEKAHIVAIDGEPGLVQRLYELGLLEGETIEFVASAPLGDPIEILIGNSRLTLRKVDAAGVKVNRI